MTGVLKALPFSCGSAEGAGGFAASDVGYVSPGGCYTGRVAGVSMPSP